MAALRRRLGMAQERFAGAIRVPVATLRNWEQHRVEPDPAATALLWVLHRAPQAALRALTVGQKRTTSPAPWPPGMGVERRLQIPNGLTVYGRLRSGQ